jgi:transposase
MLGMGPLLGAEFLAAIGHDLADFSGPDALAAFAGLAPAPHDSGKRNGNVPPGHYHLGLQRIFCMSALTSVRYDLNSRTFYDRKRSEGKRHTQAVIVLARRRVNVLWALIRDRRLY